MKRVLFLFAGCLLPALCVAQFKLTGRVLNIFTKQPVPRATVFLSNATNGTATDESGSFTLTNVKRGQYDLVVTSVGYESYHQNVVVNGDMTVTDVLLATKEIELNVVTIKPDPNRERYLNEFKREFLGISDYAQQCKILNLDILNIENDNTTHRLTARTDDYLEIVNQALGYRIKYYLNDFVKSRDSSYIFYQGSSLFEELPGTARQKKRWTKNRDEAYYGSPMHFFRACIGNNVEGSGFKVLRLVVKPNPKRLPDSLIKVKVQYFAHKPQTDSLLYWKDQQNLPKEVNYLINTPLTVGEYIKRTDRPGLYAVGLSDLLYVMYLPKDSKESTVPISRPLDAPAYVSTTIHLKTNYAFFDSNGVVIDPFDMIYDGFWTNSRMAEMLPVDYEPKSR